MPSRTQCCGWSSRPVPGHRSLKSLASNHTCLGQGLALGTQPEGEEGSLLSFVRTSIKTGFPVQAGAPWWPPHAVWDGRQAVPQHPLPSPCHHPSGESPAPGRHLIQAPGSAFSHRFPAGAVRAAPARRLRAPHPRVPPGRGSPLSARPPSSAISKFKSLSGVVSHPNIGFSF